MIGTFVKTQKTGGFFIFFFLLIHTFMELYFFQ